MYLVDGQCYEPDAHGLERALAAAYDNRTRPLCLCCDPAIPVYITRLSGTFVLKRMPFTGSRHAVGCSHYESPSKLSRIGEVLGTAIWEDPDTGLTRLRVGFAISKGAPRTDNADAGQNSESVRGDGSRLSLRGLLQFLWHEAELTRWHPGFAGRRSWAVVRSHLLSAARRMIVRDALLADVLYVPESFSVAKRDEIGIRRNRQFADGLAQHNRARPLMMLIGEIREIVAIRSHFNVVVKHVPDVPFFLDGELYWKMRWHFEQDIALWTGSNDTHLVIAATFALADWGQPAIVELCLVPTTAQWLPLDDCFEKQLMDRLVSERRTFNKSLGFNAKLPSCSISAVLLDTPEAPVALAVDRTFGSETESGSRSMATAWRWRVHTSDLPALPT